MAARLRHPHPHRKSDIIELEAVGKASLTTRKRQSEIMIGGFEPD
jgi:hypothetical protein